MLADTKTPTTSLSPADPSEARALLEARRAGTDDGGPLQLAGLKLLRADLAGLDLAGADLRGADLSCSILAEVNLFGAQLAGATLFECDLSGAELSGADLSEANLTNTNLTRAGLGGSKLIRATLDRADLTGATLTSADLTGARLQMAVLEEARLLETNLTSADLTSARLSHANLDGSAVKGAIFDLAELRSASLSGLDGYQQASWLGVDLRDIDFTGAYLCRNFILDQNYIQEFRSQTRWTEFVYQTWRLTSDCGRSISRWAFCTAVIVFAFAWAYTFVGIDYGAHPTPLSPVYFSVVTLTTLGYGDVLPASVAGQIVAMVQVITGYVMLGGLLSIFSNKMASRAH